MTAFRQNRIQGRVSPLNPLSLETRASSTDSRRRKEILSLTHKTNNKQGWKETPGLPSPSSPFVFLALLL